MKIVTNHTFEYEAVGKDDPGYVECRVHFDYTPGTPESGRYNCPPENYDPGSGAEIAFDYAEREVETDGKKVWNRLKTAEWLDEHCQAWLAAQDESDLENDLPDLSGPDPDDERDRQIDREMTERERPSDERGRG